jgi:hypothetical protein
MRFYTGQHQFYGGVDLHARTMYTHVLDARGRTVLDRDLPVAARRDERDQFFARERRRVVQPPQRPGQRRPALPAREDGHQRRRGLDDPALTVSPNALHDAKDFGGRTMSSAAGAAEEP